MKKCVCDYCGNETESVNHVCEHCHKPIKCNGCENTFCCPNFKFDGETLQIGKPLEHEIEILFYHDWDKFVECMKRIDGDSDSIMEYHKNFIVDLENKHIIAQHSGNAISMYFESFDELKTWCDLLIDGGVNPL